MKGGRKSKQKLTYILFNIILRVVENWKSILY